jgi:hypothetical protein
MSSGGQLDVADGASRSGHSDGNENDAISLNDCATEWSGDRSACGVSTREASQAVGLPYAGLLQHPIVYDDVFYSCKYEWGRQVDIGETVIGSGGTSDVPCMASLDGERLAPQLRHTLVIVPASQDVAVEGIVEICRSFGPLHAVTPECPRGGHSVTFLDSRDCLRAQEQLSRLPSFTKAYATQSDSPDHNVTGAKHSYEVVERSRLHPC